MMFRSFGLIGLLVLLSACGRSDPLVSIPQASAQSITPEITTPLGGERNLEMEGFFSLRFEVSSFVPCGAGGQPGYGKGFWLNADPALGFARRYEAALAQQSSALTTTAQPISGAPVYIRVIADLSPPSANGYGHLNQYEREMTVNEILELSRDGVCRN